VFCLQTLNAHVFDVALHAHCTGCASITLPLSASITLPLFDVALHAHCTGAPPLRCLFQPLLHCLCLMWPYMRTALVRLYYAASFSLCYATASFSACVGYGVEYALTASTRMCGRWPSQQLAGQQQQPESWTQQVIHFFFVKNFFFRCVC
jgi:hypothetical protein